MATASPKEFASEWIAAWNTHNLERILSHYSENVEFLSPVAAKRLGNGRIVGLAALHAYWLPALRPDSTLRFNLVQVLAGFQSLTIIYDASLPAGLGTKRAAETFEFGPTGKIVRSMACYAS
jgi:SnoaL-like domain